MSASLMSTVMRKAKGLMLNHFPMMINCGEFESFLLDYLEGSLPPRQRMVFELHMKLCRECREYLIAYRRTVEVSKRAFADGAAQLPDDVPEDLIRAILSARES